MKMNKKIVAVMVAATALLAGCSKSAGKPAISSVTAENGEIKIEKAALSKSASFVNYDVDGTTMQLVAGIASDGSYRVSLNTCQSCNPSPKAFFTESDGLLTCNNCGNKFSMDDVGASGIGCNPTKIESSETEEALVIQADEMEKYVSMFANGQGVK